MSSEPTGEVHGPKPALSVRSETPSMRRWREEGRPEAGTPEMQMRAARAFAKFINAFETEPFYSLLAPDVTYTRQRPTADSSLSGASEVIRFSERANRSNRRFRVQTYPRILNAELGRMASSGIDTTGVIGTRNGHRCTFWSFLFDRSGRVKSFVSHRHHPDPKKADGFGEWPGLDKADLLQCRNRWLYHCQSWVWEARTRPFCPLIFWTFGSSPEQLAEVFGLYMIDLPVLYPLAQLRGQIITSERTGGPGTYGESPRHLYTRLGLHSFPAVAVQLGPVILRYGLGPYHPDNVYQELAELGLRPDVEV